MTRFTVGIVGATGAVGLEIVKCLHSTDFPVQQIKLFASAKSAGSSLTTEYGNIFVEEYALASARSCQLVFLAVSGEFALENALLISENNGPFVIDNSSAFRYDQNVPLVV